MNVLSVSDLNQRLLERRLSIEGLKLILIDKKNSKGFMERIFFLGNEFEQIKIGYDSQVSSQEAIFCKAKVNVGDEPSNILELKYGIVEQRIICDDSLAIYNKIDQIRWILNCDFANSFGPIQRSTLQKIYYNVFVSNLK